MSLKHFIFLFSAFIFSFAIFCSVPSEAYPEFIGYGYSSCLTCHVNGQGGGPLSDYGRALWSAEISSRALYPASMSDEDIAAQSGFLGSKELPWWVRPHIKYRGIDLQRGPGSNSEITKYYQMQADVGAAVQFDPIGKYLAVLTYGNVPSPENYGAGQSGLKRMIAREYYLRVQLSKTYWLYAGLMDKVFGIRNIDHTSYQRAYQGFAVRNDTPAGIAQSQSIVIHKIEQTWELAGDYFVGNPYDSAFYKQKGYSGMGEYEIGENKRIGASVLKAKSDSLQKNMVAVHYRQGLSKGSAFLFEYGLIQDTPSATQVRATGSYNMLQTMILLTRGYHLKATVERYNAEFKPSVPDSWKWSLGLLAFPMPRLELRAEVVNGREFSSARAADDIWALQGQIHVSL